MYSRAGACTSPFFDRRLKVSFASEQYLVQKGSPRTGNLATTLIPKRPDPSYYSLVYMKDELHKAQKWGFKRDLGGRGGVVNECGQYFFPQTAACQVIREAHHGTHYGRDALYNWFVDLMVTPGMESIISLIVETRPIRTMNIPNTRPPEAPR